MQVYSTLLALLQPIDKMRQLLIDFSTGTNAVF